MNKTTLIALAAIAGTAAADVTRYTATILPQFDTTNSEWELTYTTPHSINNNGVVTGETGDGQGFVWSTSSSSSLISSLGISADRAVGGIINDSGAIAGSFTPAGQFRTSSFYMSPTGEITVLPTLVDGLGAGVTGMNNAGFMVGSAERAGGGTFGGPSVSVYWENGQIGVIGDLGGDVSTARAVNDNGVVVGYANQGIQQQVKAYTWTRDGGFRILETYLNDHATLATCINENGIVAGHASLNIFQNSAVYWDTEGRIHELGRFDPDSIDIDVRALNNDNIMVGTELMSTDFTFQARLWEDGQVYDLNDLVDGLPEGFVLSDAKDINDLGQIIVEGNMVVDGQIQFFSVLLNPVPAPASTLVLGVSGLLATRRRRA